MSDIINEKNEEVEAFDEEYDVVTLTDLESGEEVEFIVLGEAEIEDSVYMALEPVENPEHEYVILKKVATEDGETDLVNIEDDEEFDRVSDFFEDQLFSEIDYDADQN